MYYHSGNIPLSEYSNRISGILFLAESDHSRTNRASERGVSDAIFALIKPDIAASGLFHFFDASALNRGAFRVNRPVSPPRRLSCVGVKRISAAWKSLARAARRRAIPRWGRELIEIDGACDLRTNRGTVCK